MTPEQIERIIEDADALFMALRDRGYDYRAAKALTAGAMPEIVRQAVKP